MADDVVVALTADGNRITRKGFGTQLVLGYHTKNSDLRRRYSSLDELESDGHASGEPIYERVRTIFSQEPCPQEVVVGRLTTSVAPTRELTILDATEGEHIKLDVVTDDGVRTSIDYTILAAATTTTVATAVELLTEAVPLITSSSSGAVITLVMASGRMFWIENLVNCSQKDVTPDASIDDDLTAIANVDSDWYTIHSTIESKANIDTIAAWVETRDNLFGFTTSDTEEKGGSSAIFSALKGLSYANTLGAYNGTTRTGIVDGIFGRCLPEDPGSVNFAHKTVKGATPDALSSTEKSYLESQNGNHYTTQAGVGVFRYGKMPSGDWVDVRIGIHWIKARMGEDVYGLILKLKKVAYTDEGIGLIVAAMRGVLRRAVQMGILVEGTEYVNAPKAAAVDEADKVARILQNMKFGGQLQGAINKANLRGSLTF